MASQAAKRRKIDPNASQINEGYDTRLFLNSTDSSLYLCVICQCVFKEPYNIGCDNEHVFCKACLDKYFIPINSPKSCPSCRTNGLLKTKIKPSRFIERVVNQLKVKCELQLDQNENDYQCVWTGELNNLNKHINIECPLTNIFCDFCNQNMKRYQLLIEHNNICIEKPIGCDECGQEIKRRLLERHKNNKCPMKMISCDECKEDILRKDMENHHLTVCAEYEIICSYQKYGCDFRSKRILMNKHLSENEVQHLKMKVNIIENELEKFKQNNNSETSNMTWVEYFNQGNHDDKFNQMKQCYISYMNGHNIIYENNSNSIHVNILDMGMEMLLKHKKIYKDIQFKEIYENWCNEYNIKIENLLIYNYTERKNKTLRTNRHIKLDFNEDNKNDDDIKRYKIYKITKEKYIQSIYDRIGNILQTKRMFILFDKSKIQYLGQKSSSDSKTILLALKYFDIFEQKLYFVDWILVKTNNIKFIDIIKYIEQKLTVEMKGKRCYFDVLYNYCNEMNNWENKTGKQCDRFVMCEEECVLPNKGTRNDSVCKTNNIDLNNILTHDYFDGDIFIFQFNAYHPYWNSLKAGIKNIPNIKQLMNKNNGNGGKSLSLKIELIQYDFFKKGVFWYDNVTNFLESQLTMTNIELKVRENTGWKTRWIHALALQYKNDNNIPIEQDLDKDLRKKLFKSKHKWCVEKRISYCMIRNQLAYYYNINPNHIEIWLPQHTYGYSDKWDYGSKGRGKCDSKLSTLLSDGRHEWNELCPLKFEIQTYKMTDFDDMTSYDQSTGNSYGYINNDVKFSKRIKELAMFNLEIIAPNKANSGCGNMTMSFCKNWTAKNLVNGIMKEVIENPIFGYTFFSKIVEYIRANEIDSDKYIDDINILKSLTADRFLICDEDDKRLPTEYYMNKQYKMPDSFSQIKYTDFRVQFLTKNDPLVLNKNKKSENKIDIDDNDGDNEMDIDTDNNNNKTEWITKGMWVYICRDNPDGTRKYTRKVRIVIKKGESFKDVIMKYLKRYLKIDYSIVESKNNNNNNNNNNEISNDDILFEQIFETHKFYIKGTQNKVTKGILENPDVMDDIKPKMYLFIQLQQPKNVKKIASPNCICKSLINNNENISLLWEYVSKTTKDALGGAECQYKTIGEIANATKQEIGQYVKDNKKKFDMANKKAWLNEYQEICGGLNGIVQSSK